MGRIGESDRACERLASGPAIPGIHPGGTRVRTMIGAQKSRQRRAMAWAAVLASVALNAEALELSFAVADETGEVGRGAAAATTLANMPSDYSLMLTGSEDLAGPAVGLSFTVTNRSELTQMFRITASFLVSGGSLVDAAAAPAGTITSSSS